MNSGEEQKQVSIALGLLTQNSLDLKEPKFSSINYALQRNMTLLWHLKNENIEQYLKPRLGCPSKSSFDDHNYCLI